MACVREFSLEHTSRYRRQQLQQSGNADDDVNYDNNDNNDYYDDNDDHSVKNDNDNKNDNYSHDYDDDNYDDCVREFSSQLNSQLSVQRPTTCTTLWQRRRRP